MDSQSILDKLRQYMQLEGLSNPDHTDSISDQEYIYMSLQVLKETQNILAGLRQDFRPQGVGIRRKLKNIIIGRVASITRNTVERSFINQQKTNALLAYLVEETLRQNQSLQARVAKLEEQLLINSESK